MFTRVLLIAGLALLGCSGGRMICVAADAEPATIQTATTVEALVAKGVQVKRNAAKEVSEVWVFDKTTFSEADFAAIKSMTSVKTLFLRQVTRQLDDEILTILGPLPSVDYLYTNMATISDEGMKSLAGWTGLQRLTLIHWGWANGWKPFPSGKIKIGQGLAHLAALPNLKQLDIGSARIDDSALTAVAMIKTLEEVRLFHAVAVSDAGVPSLASLPKLRSVQFGSPRLTNLALEHLSKIPTLTEIEMDETWLTYANGFRHLKSLTNLTSVTLKNVICDEADIAALKADHPQAKIEWTKPDEKMLAKLTAEKANIAKNQANGKANK